MVVNVDYHRNDQIVESCISLGHHDMRSDHPDIFDRYDISYHITPSSRYSHTFTTGGHTTVNGTLSHGQIFPGCRPFGHLPDKFKYL